jgi:anti-anti-sigma factor
MNFEAVFISNRVPVTVLTTHGDIDGSNYRELINVVKKLYLDGTRDLLLDLGDTTFMSSSGMVALHSIALMLNGNQTLDVEDGWNALHSMGEGEGLGGPQPHLKLLNVRERVSRTLDISGLKPFYEIFSDRETALSSFGQEKTTSAS